MKKETTRIYFKIDEQLTYFYWVTLGNDGSVYFGSALAKNPKRGFCGKNSSVNGETRLNDENSRPLSQEEMKTKYSLHSSGTFILPNNEGESRKRCYTLKLENYKKTIPFVALIPHRLSKYKQTNKKPKPNDLLIDISEFKDQPFAMALYLNHEFKTDLTKLFPSNTYDIFKNSTTQLGHYELGAVVYANSSTFTKWPELEFSCTLDPKNTSGDLPWTIFKSF